MSARRSPPPQVCRRRAAPRAAARCGRFLRHRLALFGARRDRAAGARPARRPASRCRIDELHIDIRHRFQPPFAGPHLLGTDQLGRDHAGAAADGRARSRSRSASPPWCSAPCSARSIGAVAGYYGGLDRRRADALRRCGAVLPVDLPAAGAGGLRQPDAGHHHADHRRDGLDGGGAHRRGADPRAARARLRAWRPRCSARPTATSCSASCCRTRIGADRGRGDAQRGARDPARSPMSASSATASSRRCRAGATCSNNAQEYLGSAPWLAIFPGIAITLAVTSFNFLGDGLRDALDPRLDAAMSARARGARTCRVRFRTDDGVVPAVNGVSFTVRRRRDAGAGRRIRLGQERDQPRDHAPARRATARDARWQAARSRDGGDTRSARAAGERRCARSAATAIAMIFQEPMTSLNPVLTVGEQIAEADRYASRDGPRAPRSTRAARAARPRRHPRCAAAARELSAPALRRHAPARHDRHGAAPANPSVLIADEPTTALDVTVQAQILELLQRAAGAHRHGGDVHHPQSRRGGRDRRPGDGDVCGPDRRAGARSAAASSGR